MAYHMKIKEAANYLGCSPRTVHRRIEQGLLDGKRHGASLYSPTVIPTEQVLGLVKLRRNMEVIDTLQASRPDPIWEHQVRELSRRAQKLEELVGHVAIVELLKRFGAVRFYDLHPNQLRSMHGALLRLARGLRPYVRDAGVSVAEEGVERRRQKRMTGRPRGRPRKVTPEPWELIRRDAA
jgi:hypothetical protein